PLISPGSEGVRGLEIGNAMLMAGLTRHPVDLPLDADAYDRFLQDLTSHSTGQKTLQPRASTVIDMSSSFAKPSAFLRQNLAAADPGGASPLIPDRVPMQSLSPAANVAAAVPGGQCSCRHPRRLLLRITIFFYTGDLLYIP